MICKNCQTKNIKKAQFCRHCGEAFTDEQRQQAYDRTVYGKIEKLEKWKGYATLDFITGHPIFKTLVLVAILVWGLLLGRGNGNQMLIMESKSYRVQQHVTSGDYYVLTDLDRVSVSLYLPRQAESLRLQAVIDGQTVRDQTFAADELPALEYGAADYYLITADYGDGTERITVFVVRE